MSRLLEVIERSTRLDEKTKADYSRAIGRFLQFAGHDSHFWTPLIVEDWRDQLAESLKPQTVNKHLYALRYASSRLEALALGNDFARSAESLRVTDRARRKALTIDEVRRLMRTCDYNRPIDVRDRALMTVALVTGLRRDNLVIADWKQIDGRTFHVVQKGSRAHSVVLNDRAVDSLLAWADVLHAFDIDTQSGPIWWGLKAPTNDRGYDLGNPIRSPQWMNRVLRRRSIGANVVPHAHPHLFRHTLISWLVDRVPMSRIMRQTGQESLATVSCYVTDQAAEDSPIGDHLPDFY